MARKRTPRFDLAKQVKRLGADSLLPPEPRRAPSAATMRLIKQWFEGYEVREGDDGRMGIYTRDYNVRLARFNINTHCIQSRLKLLFNYCNAPDEPKRKPRRRRARSVDPGAFGLDCLGDGFTLHRDKRK